MNTPLTNKECVASILSSVDHWISKGLDYKSAIKVASELRSVDYNKVEHFWIEREWQRMDKETS